MRKLERFLARYQDSRLPDIHVKREKFTLTSNEEEKVKKFKRYLPKSGDQRIVKPRFKGALSTCNREVYNRLNRLYVLKFSQKPCFIYKVV